MSTALYGNVPCEFAIPAATASFIAADTTKVKLIVDPQGAAAAAGTQPLKQGGCTVIDCTIASSDATARDVQLWAGSVVTTQEATATGTITTTTSTIVRATGSWITAGVRPGCLVMMFAPLNLAENASIDGILGVVTAVTATTITVNGTPFAVSAGLAAGTRIAIMSPLYRVNVPGSSGVSSSVPNVAVIDAANNNGVIRTELKLGATNILAAGMAATINPLPAYVNVAAQIARY